MIPSQVQPWIQEALDTHKVDIESQIIEQFPALHFAEEGTDVHVGDVSAEDARLNADAEVKFIEEDVAKIESSAEVTYSANASYTDLDSTPQPAEIESEKVVVRVTIRAKLNPAAKRIDQIVNVAVSEGVAGHIAVHIPKTPEV